MDEQLRRLDRQAATGDPEAKAKAIQHELRSGHWQAVQCLECVATDRTPGCKECDGHGYVRVKLEDLLPLRRREPDPEIAQAQESFDRMDEHARNCEDPSCCGPILPLQCQGWTHGLRCLRGSGHHGEHTSDPVAAGRIVPYVVRDTKPEPTGGTRGS